MTDDQSDRIVDELVRIADSLERIDKAMHPKTGRLEKVNLYDHLDSIAESLHSLVRNGIDARRSE
jgi:hypothetical protein